MASHMEMLEMENTKLKESNKKLTKHFKTTEDKISPLKVCIYNIPYSWKFSRDKFFDDYLFPTFRE